MTAMPFSLGLNGRDQQVRPKVRSGQERPKQRIGPARRPKYRPCCMASGQLQAGLPRRTIDIAKGQVSTMNLFERSLSIIPSLEIEKPFQQRLQTEMGS